ncbi:hypothetical protein TWF788_005360 [Orbilia oligospora]|uniref:CCHC-type domain-containing protein n=1 Tax=Orbilia oligospora TaxID=2813651 RepID=A0A7C8PYS0_ORBOL|nr:hypothetical protein TWF788_005360 [Orbilia oligospora]
MSGWDDGPVQVDEAEWVPPPMPVATGLTTNNISSGDNFFEDGADGGDRPRGTPGACRKCNEEGHFAAECPNQKCSCCGQKGHSASKCPTPKCNICNTEGHIPFECPQKDNQACRHCGETGHMVKECPIRANEPCRNCQQIGHRAAECTNQRKMQFGGADLEGEVEDKDQKIEACWNNMDQASKDRDLDAFKDVGLEYLAFTTLANFTRRHSSNMLLFAQIPLFRPSKTPLRRKENLHMA